MFGFDRFWCNFLMSKNHTTGRRGWLVWWFVGTAIVLLWVAATLPWIDVLTGSRMGIGHFGARDFPTTFVAYGYEMPSRVADYYFLAIFFGIAIMKMAYLMASIAWNFAHGMIFVWLPQYGIASGHWIPSRA